MDKDTFTKKLQEIGSMETIEEVRAGLADLKEGVTGVFDSNASLEEQHKADSEEMEAIRQANMKLFTRLGTDTTPAKQVEEQTGLKQEPVKHRKFEDLLNQQEAKGDNKLFKA